MALTLLADRQYTAPSAAAPVSITPNGTAWANSAYVTVLDPTPAACVLTGVTVYTADTNGNCDVEIDIATGAAAAEVVIATVRAYFRFIANSQWGPTGCCVLPIPIDNITTGTRVSARMRKNDTDVANVWRVAVTYLQKPLTSTILTTANPQKTLPAAAVGVTVTAGGSAWASGSWAQLRSAAGSALVITGVVCGAPSISSAVDYELDLGTGAASAETVISTIRVTAQLQSAPCWFMLPTPLDNVAAGARVAARLRCATASATMVVSLMVLEQPL